jgi:F-type H+-transporting ATPase subunit delta
VTSRTAALRYARALFDVVATEERDRRSDAAGIDAALQAAERQLASFADLFTQHETLAKVLINPAVPAPRKRAAVTELLREMKIASPAGKLLVLLAERDRLALLPEIMAAYRQRLLDHQDVVRAEITTTTPLAADRAKAIEQRLARATGRQVTLVARVDPSIIGGVVTRIGSIVYDGSVTRQLQKMKEQLEQV